MKLKHYLIILSLPWRLLRHKAQGPWGIHHKFHSAVDQLGHQWGIFTGQLNNGLKNVIYFKHMQNPLNSIWFGSPCLQLRQLLSIKNWKKRQNWFQILLFLYVLCSIGKAVYLSDRLIEPCRNVNRNPKIECIFIGFHYFQHFFSRIKEYISSVLEASNYFDVILAQKMGFIMASIWGRLPFKGGFWYKINGNW